MIIFPLPKVVTEMLWTAKLNDFLPGLTVKTEKTRFYLFREFHAQSVGLDKDGCAVLDFKNLRIKHSVFFVFTGRGNLKLTADAISIKIFPKGFNFLSKVLGESLGREMVFENVLVESVIDRNKIIINRLEGSEKNFKVMASGYSERKQKIDFTVEILFSEQFVEAMSEDTKKFLIETQEDDVGKIKLRIHGSPQKPSFEMKTNFLEVIIS